jgi:hypothetical protein
MMGTKDDNFKRRSTQSPGKLGPRQRLAECTILLGIVGTAVLLPAGRVAAAEQPAAEQPPHAAKLIRNHTAWRDTQGNPIDCHEGGLLRVGAKYFWYGRSYHGNDRGIYGTEGAKFRCGINCYSSGNLVDWTFAGRILSYPDLGWITTGTWHRPRVVFNEKTSKYVLWFFCLGIPDGKPWVKDVVAIADHPTGPFQILGERKMPIEPSGDLALLVDVDGRGYLANGDWRRNGFVLRLTDDFQNATGEPVKALPAGHLTEYEGLSMARFKDKYIFAGSGVAGLDPTETTYAVADAAIGPYTVKGLMSEKKTWRSQLSSLTVIPETNTLFALCEQWLIGPDGQPITAEKSTQLWIPVSFDPKTGTARMRYVKEWDPSLTQE